MTSPAAEAGTSSCLVKVRLFAGLREQAGWGTRLLPVNADGGTTPLTVWQELQLDEVWRAAHPADAEPEANAIAAHPHREAGTAGPEPDVTGRDGEPHGKALPPGVRVAINQAFAATDTPLGDGDELAFLPPISGG